MSLSSWIIHDILSPMLDHSSDFAARPAPDSLSEILQDLRPSKGSYGRCELTQPWGIIFPPQPQARFHFVVAGDCWLQTSEFGWARLRAGDIAFFPRGTPHVMADDTRSTFVDFQTIPQEEIGEKTYAVRLGDGDLNTQTLLVCCSVSFAEPSTHPLLESMPEVLLLRGDASRDAALGPLLAAIAGEATARRIGAATVLTRLADAVIVHVVRAWVEEAGNTIKTGWIAATRDPKIGRVLAAVHNCPQHRWSVGTLAAIANMSRSAFSERFTAIVGVSPARYVSRWRLHLAGVWLREKGFTVGEVAKKLNYESEASFSRAFKRQFAVPPSSVRNR